EQPRQSIAVAGVRRANFSLEKYHSSTSDLSSLHHVELWLPGMIRSGLRLRRMHWWMMDQWTVLGDALRWLWPAARLPVYRGLSPSDQDMVTILPQA
ncbi:hypothetical protein LTR22_028237, partial [Elasticomyces elasticus]